MMKLFTLLDAKAFARDVAYFASAKRAEMVERFWNYVANCVAKALESGDQSHLNKAASAAEMCGYGPTFRRVVPAVAPFKFDKKAMQFTGKIRKGKRELLQEYDRGVQAWERILKAGLDGKTSSKPAAEFNLDAVGKRAKTLARSAFEAGLNRQECRKAISEAFAAVYGPEVKPTVDKTADKPASAKLVDTANRDAQVRELNRTKSENGTPQHVRQPIAASA